jgi:midasin
VNLCEQTDPAELIGKYVPVGQDRFAWVDGTLIRAMKEGVWLFLDDINLAPSQILERMNSLLDEDACVMVTEHRGEKVVPDPDFRLFAARNPLRYKGRQRLSRAFVNKFTQIYVREHPEAEMEQILVNKGLEPKVAEAMIDRLGRVRQLLKKRTRLSRLGDYRFGLRDLLRFRDYLNAYQEVFGLERAFAKGAMYAFWDRLETQELRQVVHDGGFSAMWRR